MINQSNGPDHDIASNEKEAGDAHEGDFVETVSVNEEPGTLGDVIKLVIFASLMLGAGAVVAFFVAWLLMGFLPQQFVGPGLVYVALVAISPLSHAINTAWIQWVVRSGVRWIFPVRQLVRFMSIGGVILGFFLFWSILNPLAAPWVASIVKDRRDSDEVLLAEAVRAAHQSGEFRLAEITGKMSPNEEKKFEQLVNQKFLEKNKLWSAVVLPIFAGVNTCVGAMLLWSSLLAWNAAKRSASFHRKADATVSDVEGQVAYFRSFKSDSVPAYQEGFWSGFQMKSEEEILAECMPSGKRFFAIGRPGEPLPEIGASRMYFSDEEWQAAASTMMKNAALILIRPHSTPSLVWEIQHIVAAVPTAKCAIWLAPSFSTNDWIAFKKEVEQHLPHKLPPFSRLRGANFVVFSTDWAASGFALETKEMKSFGYSKKPLEGKKLLTAELRSLISRAKASIPPSSEQKG